MNPKTIPMVAARRIALRAQGLAEDTAPFGLGKAGALGAIEHLGYVQVDTISVVERAHHHVLWTRVPGYQPRIVHDLQEPDRSVFEHWSHAASYLPMRDYRHSLPIMRERQRKPHWFDHSHELKRAMRRVLRKIREDGALQLRDFKAGEGVSSFWGTAKIERHALHELWMHGKVMIRSRAGFQKVYDLPERVLPAGVDTTMPKPVEHAEFGVRAILRAHGLVRERDLGYLAGGVHKDLLRKTARRLAKSGQIVEVRVEGHEKTVCYTTLEALDQSHPLTEERVRVLSPFDNVVIQRERLKWLFDFDYTIECYVPEKKRKHGYFVLPILAGEKFIGRMDAKAERSTEKLIVSRLYSELGTISSELRRKFTEALHAFAEFNGCHRVEFSKEATRDGAALLR